jgi:XisI protein
MGQRQNRASKESSYPILDFGFWIGDRNFGNLGIANELMKAGISKDEIVLGFHEPEIRPHTGFAVA